MLSYAEDQGISRHSLAVALSKLGVSLSTTYQFLRRPQNSSIETIDEIAAAFCRLTGKEYDWQGECSTIESATPKQLLQEILARPKGERDWIFGELMRLHAAALCRKLKQA